ncbi:hypothetical protein [Sulfurihydrogenibium sp.]|uniref:hypothetical protein n=1 Tax=Sulfurihydrogenibium sp. TaxID=2053621 RepID=UPI003D0FA075
MRFIVVLLAFFLVSCDKVKDVFQEKDILQRPVAKRCSECHENIYNQVENYLGRKNQKK